jgi:transcriptional regulator GlxA family with amidase domain
MRKGGSFRGLDVLVATESVPSLGRMRRIVIVAFPEFQSLDVTGPFDVFGLATQHAPAPGREPAYVVELAALDTGALVSSSGLTVIATRSLRDPGRGIDTLLIAGGRGARAASNHIPLLDEICRLAPSVRRLGSVCTGAFVLAAAGQLDGRRVTTHWQFATELATLHPQIQVDADAIFVKDAPIYTSAGVTAGIDLALALVEEDLGRDVALAVARDLVVFARRPGGQSQFSAQLASQFAAENGIRTLQRWMIEHPDADLSVEPCAARVGMSPRNFARVFTREMGVTPAVWVEAMRVERAQMLLVDTDRGVEDIAAFCGFGSSETMRRAFLRRLRVSPNTYRQRFQIRSSEARLS